MTTEISVMYGSEKVKMEVVDRSSNQKEMNNFIRKEKRKTGLKTSKWWKNIRANEWTNYEKTSVKNERKVNQ